MSQNSIHINHLLKDKKFLQLLQKYNIGLEKETLRISKTGKLSNKPHPEKLGKTLTHKNITTDFSESQLEIITDVFTDINNLYQELTDLHTYIYHNIDSEILWTSSMPCKLNNDNDIPIAHFGTSTTGQFKHIYRQGLKNRYGAKMQTISGIHFNFSFSDQLINYIFTKNNSSDNLQNFRSKLYLHVSRNLLRLTPFLTYFFGASPKADSSYLQSSTQIKYATSLRMSNLGYVNPTRCRYNISYNSLAEYIKNLEHALNTNCPTFKILGIKNKNQYKQLNTNILQIEAEEYGLVRPKANTNHKYRTLENIKKNGFSYVEFRGIDINPFNKIGIEKDDLYFLHIIFIYALLQDSPEISDTELKQIKLDRLDIALKGRQINISSNSFTEKSNKIIDELNKLLIIFDDTTIKQQYQDIINHKRQMINNVTLTTSAKCNTTNKSYLDNILDISNQHAKYFHNIKLSTEKQKLYNELSNQSIIKQQKLKTDKIPIDIFIKEYFK